MFSREYYRPPKMPGLLLGRFIQFDFIVWRLFRIIPDERNQLYRIVLVRNKKLSDGHSFDLLRVI